MSASKKGPDREALRLVRVAAQGGYFDDLNTAGDFREEVRRRIADLLGEEYADRVGFYRGSGENGDKFRFWMRVAWVVDDIRAERAARRTA